MIFFSDPGFVGLWYVEVTHDINFMGALYDKEDGAEFVWRMRYHESTGAPDTKNWHRQKAKPGKPIQEILEFVRISVQVMTEKATGPMQEFLLGSKTINEFAEELAQQPFIQCRKASEEEAREIDRWKNSQSN